MSKATTFLKIIDSHTGGEQTRLVIEGCPDLGSDTLEQKRVILSEQHSTPRTTWF